MFPSVVAALPAREGLEDEDRLVVIHSVEQALAIFDHRIADEDVDVLAERTAFVHDVVAQAGEAVIECCDDFGDVAAFDLQPIVEIGEIAKQMAGEIDTWRRHPPINSDIIEQRFSGCQASQMIMDYPAQSSDGLRQIWAHSRLSMITK